MDAFQVWAEETTASLAAWAHPELNYDARPTKGWAFMRPDIALYVTGGYLVLVAIGYSLRPSNWRTLAPEPSSGVKGFNFAAMLVKDPIRFLQVVYNTTQIVLCSYMVYGTIAAFIRRGMTPLCNPFVQDDVDMATMEWLFCVSKILDFMDTFFIIVRKSWVRLSFLHTYHHASVFLFQWWLSNIGYSGDIYYAIVANSLVHLVMYTYYLIATVSKSPWWGKYLTQFQMVQFVTMLFQSSYLLYNSCPYPHSVLKVYLVYIISLLALFLNFYFAKHSSGPKPAAGGKPVKKD